LADKVLSRAAKVGVTPGPVVKPGTVVEPGSVVEPVEPLGEELLALVVKAREAGLDPEQELRDAVRRLAEAVRAAESE